MSGSVVYRGEDMQDIGILRIRDDGCTVEKKPGRIVPIDDA